MAADKAAKSASCFVVMPITVQSHLLDRYGGRSDHFLQIYRALIAPALEKAGLLCPSPPKREGTENIQAGIIKDLLDSDLVLADLSGLNPNVFLELGVRSALDKPVCLVWDGQDGLPFDAGTLNTHKYDPRPLYGLNDEIAKMAEHITATLKKSDGRNELWKYFGRASGALPTAELNPADLQLTAKLDRLLELAEREYQVVRAFGLDADPFSSYTFQSSLGAIARQHLHMLMAKRDTAELAEVETYLSANMGGGLYERWRGRDDLPRAVAGFGFAVMPDDQGRLAVFSPGHRRF